MENKTVRQIGKNFIYFIFLLLIGLFIGYVGSLFFGVTKVSGINTRTTGYKAGDNALKVIVTPVLTGSYYRCAYVDVNTCPGSYIFIPTKTVAEWDAFRMNMPSCIGNYTMNVAAHTGATWQDHTVGQSGGSWDWNCNGSVTKQWNGVDTYLGGGCGNACFLNDVCGNNVWCIHGGTGPVVKDCGETGWIELNVCQFFQCTASTRIQGCK